MKKQFYSPLFLGLIAVFSFALVSSAQAGSLEQVTITPGSTHGGRVSEYKVSFIVASSTEIAAKIRLIFPAGFNVSNVSATSSMTASSAGASVIADMTVSGQEITIVLADGSVTTASDTIEISGIPSIQNPFAGGLITLGVQTRTAADELSDSASSSVFVIYGDLPTETTPVKLSYTAPPTSQITSPTVDEVIPGGEPYVIAGSVKDQGIYVANKVEVSVDGEKTWLIATVTGSSWEYTWESPAEGSYTITSRATDTAGNVEDPLKGGINVTVSAAAVSSTPTPTPTPTPTLTTLAELETALADVQQQLLGLLQKLVALLTAQLQP